LAHPLAPAPDRAFIRLRLRGLATLVRTQPNFRIHLVAAVLALCWEIVLRLSTAEMALLVLTVGTVLVVEALNTCLETLCDRLADLSPLVKKSKDVSAAAVLISALAAVGVAALLFLPRLF